MRMIAVIFEVWPAEGRKDDYLGLAAALRADLAHIDGFISIERFQSLTDPGKLLSLSFWRDEDAVRTWRNNANHRRTQAAGRAGIFADYRLRIASVVRDYGMTERREQGPAAPPGTHHPSAPARAVWNPSSLSPGGRPGPLERLGKAAPLQPGEQHEARNRGQAANRKEPWPAGRVRDVAGAERQVGAADGRERGQQRILGRGVQRVVAQRRQIR